MIENLNVVDRLIRGVIGISTMIFVCFNGNYLEEPIIEVLLVVFSLVNLISLATGWCPVYHIAKISTRNK